MIPLHRQFIRTAKKYGSKTAIIDRSTEKTMTYERALIASLLMMKKIGIYRDGFIGVMVPTSAGCMLSILGILMAGKVPVMINYATGAAENAEYAQRKCGFRTIIASRALLEKIGCRLVPGMIFIEDLIQSVSALLKVRMALAAKMPLGMLDRMVHRGEADDNLVILFTSGSEKDPKAVQLTHRNIGSNVADIHQVLEIKPEDIFLANLPLFHVFGHNIDFWLPILSGCAIASYANPIDYKKICQIIREERVTLMVGTPTFFQGYLRQSEPGDFATVRIAVAGADKTSDSLRRGYWEKHQLELFEGYGTTETSPVVSTNLPGANKHGSIGRILPSVRVRIADLKTNEELLAGREGKILVKGDLVMKGYFDDIEETSLRIHDGWYETGDMGMIDEEGYLWHRGRLKRFVKIGGEMISLVKVETALAELLDENTECCIVEVPDSLKGAKIVAVTTQAVNERAILKKMGQSLPAIALPRQFVVIHDLPRMGSGKTDFRQLTELVRSKLSNT